MPCMDSGPSYEDERRSQEATTRRERDERSRLDKLTRMLCTTIKILHYQDVEMHFPGVAKKDIKEIQEWAVAHEEFDKRRLEEAKKSGLAKLTEDEREALGL